MSLRNKRNIKRGAGLCALSLIAGMSIFANVGGSVSARPMNPSGVGGNGNRRPGSPTSNSSSSLTRPSGLSGGTSSPTGLGANGSSRLGSPNASGLGGDFVEATLNGPNGPVKVTAQTKNPQPDFWDTVDGQKEILAAIQGGDTGSTSLSSGRLGSPSSSRLGSPNASGLGGDFVEATLNGPNGPVKVTAQTKNPQPDFWDTVDGQKEILAAIQGGNTGSTSRGSGIRRTPLTQEQQDEVSKILQRNTTQR